MQVEADLSPCQGPPWTGVPSSGQGKPGLGAVGGGSQWSLDFWDQVPCWGQGPLEKGPQSSECHGVPPGGQGQKCVVLSKAGAQGLNLRLLGFLRVRAGHSISRSRLGHQVRLLLRDSRGEEGLSGLQKHLHWAASVLLAPGKWDRGLCMCVLCTEGRSRPLTSCQDSRRNRPPVRGVLEPPV